jgi:hypothetical protein
VPAELLWVEPCAGALGPAIGSPRISAGTLSIEPCRRTFHCHTATQMMATAAKQKNATVQRRAVDRFGFLIST